MRKIMVVASGLLLLSLSLAWWVASRQQKPVEIIPVLTGQPEYCLTCHAELPEISSSHPVKTFGCVSCHGGERLALNADLAHSTMRGGANPSDLAVAEISCGGSSCHSGSEAENRDHIQRVMTSVQSTYAGAIANIRFTFGAQPDLIAQFGIKAIMDEHTQSGIQSLQEFNASAETNPMIQKFGENCLNCHLHAAPQKGNAFVRQTGCAACHSTGKHTLSTAIPYTQCNACHNRGNYDLRTMTFVERTDQPVDRVHDYYQPIAQFTKCEYTLDCVDCHTRSEAMGDGDIHSNQKEIQYVQCKTCHGTLNELPLTKTLADPNDIAFRMSILNPVVGLKIGDTILMTEKGEPLWNTRVLSDGTYEMIGKATKQRFNFRPVMGSTCQQNPKEQSSQYCHKCHSVER
ncbi:MAG: cytochrome c3 family protein [Chloroflexi bacterium]|nr:cytochrome c3 family protein [Chloroflexota bacterium]